jgi:hypothetical protein
MGEFLKFDAGIVAWKARPFGEAPSAQAAEF